MPNKVMAAFQGIRKILQEPFLISNYEEALRAEERYGLHCGEENPLKLEDYRQDQEVGREDVPLELEGEEPEL